MGQYYKVVNVDKGEYVHPHDFGDGLKLLEFGDSRGGTMLGLAILLADGNGRGGGDLHSDNPIIGSWAGDRIVVAGDYADECKFCPAEENLYEYAERCYKNISLQVIEALCDDSWIRENFKKKAQQGYAFGFAEGAKKALRPDLVVELGLKES